MVENVLVVVVRGVSVTPEYGFAQLFAREWTFAAERLLRRGGRADFGAKTSSVARATLPCYLSSVSCIPPGLICLLPGQGRVSPESVYLLPDVLSDRTAIVESVHTSLFSYIVVCLNSW